MVHPVPGLPSIASFRSVSCSSPSPGEGSKDWVPVISTGAPVAAGEGGGLCLVPVSAVIRSAATVAASTRNTPAADTRRVVRTFRLFGTVPRTVVA